MNTQRQQDFQAWVEQQLQKHQWLPESGVQLQPQSGDAGFRCYHHCLDAEGTVLVPAILAVDAPVETEDSAAFIRIADHLRAHGVHTPQVLACDLERGFLLVEQFTGELFQSLLTQDSVELLYGEAMMSLLALQQAPLKQASGDDIVPSYSCRLLTQEMALFPQWFVEQLLGYALNDDEQMLLMLTFRKLTERAQAQTQVLVHRDYHSRNMLYCEGDAPGIIDFQDAVVGPITYDLVSLLRDCYVRWPQRDIQRWALSYKGLAEDAGILPIVNDNEFLKDFDWMGLQRHLKVLGIFARLSLRDGKHSYLNDLPLVLRYTLAVAEKYPEFTAFVSWFKDKLLPLCEQQTWYQDWQTAGA